MPIQTMKFRAFFFLLNQQISRSPHQLQQHTQNFTSTTTYIHSVGYETKQRQRQSSSQPYVQYPQYNMLTLISIVPFSTANLFQSLT